MGLFKKKHDPISERERALNEQIAALESEIQHLASGTGSRPKNVASLPPAKPATPAGQPRLRSTAVPKGPIPAPVNPVPASARDSVPVFEPVVHASLRAAPEAASHKHFNDLGMRKYDLAAAWRRLQNHFRGPTTSNPKLVNYLAAGSIQGLRPLRYEKRVARNRFLLLVSFLVLFLWGIIYVFLVRH